jgi:hypothetical protein
MTDGAAFIWPRIQKTVGSFEGSNEFSVSKFIRRLQSLPAPRGELYISHNSELSQVIEVTFVSRVA